MPWNFVILRAVFSFFVVLSNAIAIAQHPSEAEGASPEGKDLDFAFGCRPKRAQLPVVLRPAFWAFVILTACFSAGRISVLTLQLFGMAGRKRDPSLRSG